jgi:hypothetical protein
VTRVKIVRPTEADGGRALALGEIVDLPERDAQLLISLGKAVPVLAPLPESGAPQAQHRDPAVTRTRSRR